MDDSKTAREQRLAAALRANLHRRKEQARARAESDSRGEPDTTDSAAPDPGESGGKT